MCMSKLCNRGPLILLPPCSPMFISNFLLQFHNRIGNCQQKFLHPDDRRSVLRFFCLLRIVQMIQNEFPIILDMQLEAFPIFLLNMMVGLMLVTVIATSIQIYIRCWFCDIIFRVKCSRRPSTCKVVSLRSANFESEFLGS